ncbi:MAG TPA: hypothetical protein VG755_12605 [Nannocystaceae bacterium]|nr:hypothetical protein [Nannocystaceae bacterium]
MLLALGCNYRLVRWEREGRHAEVVKAAEDARWPPRRAAARARASALVALDRSDEARDVLLKDFRRGGQLRSLVQLADLERTLGLDGIAAVHYTRVIALDRTWLRGETEVCALLQRRAHAWNGIGEGDAALDDLERARALCGRDDAAARGKANALAKQRIGVRAQRSCGAEPCRTPTAGERARRIEQALAYARSGGPTVLRAFARAHDVSLPPDAVVLLLLADLTGNGGVALIDDDELRGWIGDASPEDFATQLRGLQQGESSYLHLRLERVQGRTPEGGRASAVQRTLWLDRARIAAGAIDWRVVASAGDVNAVEQGLTAIWRPRATPETGTAPRDPDSIAPTGKHWSLRVPVDEGSVDELLVYARVRDAAGDPELALELVRSMGSQAHEPAIANAIAESAVRALAWGRPWLALAIAEADARVDLDPLRAAAASAVLLSQALCEGECAEDAEDIAAIERVTGEGWAAGVRARLRELAFDRTRELPRAGACTSVAEALAPEQVTPLGEALTLALREPDAPGLARALARAIESDPVLACNGAVVLPLLLARNDRLTAARLAEMLAHGPELDGAPAIGLHAALALLAGEPERARHLAIRAAATAEDPAQAWRAHARVGRALGDRNAELIGLREVVLASSGLAHRDARRELLLRGLGDAWSSWGARDTPAGREAIRKNVVDHLAELAPGERWRERERIIEEIVQRPWYAVDAISWLRAAVLPDDVEPAHAIAKLRLGVGTLPDEPAVWSDELLALQIAARKVAVFPVATTVLGDPRRFVRSRLALARHARDWPVRRRAAVGLATFGSPSERALAMAELFAMASPKGKVELERVLLEGPSAVGPDGRAGALVVDDPELVVRLVSGLPLAPALLLPELDPGADLPPAGREPGAPQPPRDEAPCRAHASRGRPRCSSQRCSPRVPTTARCSRASCRRSHSASSLRSTKSRGCTTRRDHPMRSRSRSPPTMRPQSRSPRRSPQIRRIASPKVRIASSQSSSPPAAQARCGCRSSAAGGWCTRPSPRVAGSCPRSQSCRCWPGSPPGRAGASASSASSSQRCSPSSRSRSGRGPPSCHPRARSTISRADPSSHRSSRSRATSTSSARRSRPA